MKVDGAEKSGTAASAAAQASAGSRTRTWWSCHRSAHDFRRARGHGAAAELVSAGERRQRRLWALHLVAEEAIRCAAPPASWWGRADVRLGRGHARRYGGHLDRAAGLRDE